MNKLVIDAVMTVLAILCLANAFLIFSVAPRLTQGESIWAYASFVLSILMIGVDMFLAFGFFFLWEKTRKTAIIFSPIPLMALVVQLLAGSVGSGALLPLEFAGASFEPLSLLVLPFFEGLYNLENSNSWPTIIDVVWVVFATANLSVIFFLRNSQVKELFRRKSNVRVEDHS